MLPRTITALTIAAVAVTAALTSPAWTAALLAKEGPAEHASHAVLAAAVVAWALAGRRADRRAVALAMAGFLALVLVEEVDWGSVYGWTTIGERMAGAFGHRNMHNAARGSSYLLFALPLIGYFAAPRRWLGGLAPSRDERWAFVAIAGLFVAGNMSAAWERAAQELLELLLYALLLAIGLRVGRGSGRTGLTTAAVRKDS
ncbi:hypothetical protein [Nannocystis bainbridge]|uniref:Uncharacterized protein n=1 Tax=Nannocystis bainbridge TaxID=2995303 RepID=A0ABT5DQY6_9BACT|nr:hypothetical protein [Nannocystis bainbridge]MDC0715565.1 hypothetical protein [Nannocystis bainbridge]